MSKRASLSVDVPEHREIFTESGHVLHLTLFQLRTLEQGEPTVRIDRWYFTDFSIFRHHVNTAEFLLLTVLSQILQQQKLNRLIYHNIV